MTDVRQASCAVCALRLTVPKSHLAAIEHLPLPYPKRKMIRTSVMTETRKAKLKISPCMGFLLDEKFSPMINYLNFYSLLAFQNSKAELCNTALYLLVNGRDRTFRRNVPLRDLVQCENEEECYAIKKVV